MFGGWLSRQSRKASAIRVARAFGEVVVFPLLSVVFSLLVAKMWKNFVGIPSFPAMESPGMPRMVLEMCWGVRIWSREMVSLRCAGTVLLSRMSA